MLNRVDCILYPYVMCNEDSNGFSSQMIRPMTLSLVSAITASLNIALLSLCSTGPVGGTAFSGYLEDDG
ncbi:hypothetical protein VNO80_15465 [Phaseolus coccineus]|uniref:Uncharacterized protein n=1 Tax=Phaseolus coccineus TaxID=3886 RepID=A0AAN9MRH0_PHACN